MVNIVVIIALFVIINFVGFFQWPFLAYITGSDIGIMIYIVSAILGLIGVVLLIKALVQKQNKWIGIWFIAAGIASFSCCFTYIYERYGENGKFNGEYIMYSDYRGDKWPNVNGLANKFGIAKTDAKFDWVAEVFDEGYGKNIYVGVERNKDEEAMEIMNDEDENRKIYMFELCLYDENFNMKKVIDVSEKADTDNIEVFIERHIGKIMEEFSAFGIYENEKFMAEQYCADDEPEYLGLGAGEEDVTIRIIE